METEGKSRCGQINPGSWGGSLWFIGWLFTIAFARLLWWQALLALVIWPYYLGLVLR